MRIKFIDLFAGTGAFRLGFERAARKLGLNPVCVFTSEIDKFAQKTYEANFGDIPAGDFAQVDYEAIPFHRVVLASTSCQPYSRAGNRHGKRDPRNTIPFLMDYMRTVMPEALIHENVYNGFAKSGEYKEMVNGLELLGYTVQDKMYNSISVTPQNRRRLFTVAFRDFPAAFRFEWGILPELGLKMRDVLFEEVPEKYTLSDRTWEWLQRKVGDYYMNKTKWQSSIKMVDLDAGGGTLTSTYGRNGGAAILIPPELRKTPEFRNGFGYRVAEPDGTGNTLSARYKNDGAEILIEQKGKNPRRMTPRECARYMGLPDDFKIVVSDSQAYKQLGNAVVPAVVECIAEGALRAMEFADGRKKIKEVAGCSYL